MSNEFKGLAAHSAEYFGDHRDHWWRDEQIQAAAAEWGAASVGSILDVGCGVGHWGRLIGRALPAARVTGIDREPLWVEKAGERAAALGATDRFNYQVASAEALPFADSTFDLTTCQTVLIHMPDPARVIAEMARVTRPGGLVVVAEPTNFVDGVIESIAVGDPPEVTAELLRFHLVCNRGKVALGQGDNLLGERVPGLFAAAGLQGIQVRQNERAGVLIPPYDSAAQQALTDDMLDMADREIPIWPLDETRRYFLAGGGREAELEGLCKMAVEQRRRIAAALRAGAYHCSGGTLFYLIWGRKPELAGAGGQ